MYNCIVFIQAQQKAGDNLATDTIHSGVIEKIYTYDYSTHYTVFLMDNGNKYSGRIPFVHEGMKVRLEQSGSPSQIYDTIPFRKYYLEDIRSVQAAMGILKMIPGIGPKKQRQIYDRFGEDLYDTLMDNTHELSSVDGIGNKMIDNITDFVEKFKTLQPLLYSFGHILSYNEILKLAGSISNEDTDKLTKSPFRIVYYSSIDPADIDTTDIGSQISKDDLDRVAAFIYFKLDRYAQIGKTNISTKTLVSYTKKRAEVDESTVVSAIEKMKQEELVVEKVKGYLRLKYIHDMEVSIIINLHRIIEAETYDFDKGDIEELITPWQNLRHVKLSQTQKDAANALNENVSCITGGPGTGKSFIIKVIMYIAGYFEIPCTVMTPTGAAAKRLERDDIRAQTVHRYIGYDGNACKFNKDNQLPKAIYIIDESSMMSYPVMDMLLKAIPDGSKIIFVGDPNQLPPVEPGRPFIDLVASGSVHVFHLEGSHRQGSDAGDIIVAANAVLEGKIRVLDMKSKNFVIHTCEKESDMVNDIQKFLLEMKSTTDIRNVAFITRFMIMSPVRYKGNCSVRSLNDMLSKTFNDQSLKPLFKTKDGTYIRPYDVVMNRENDRSREVYNGDVGVVNQNTTGIKIYYMGLEEVKEYELYETDRLEMAYARTVHTSQGSEADYVVIGIDWSTISMWSKQMLYTAITRAKREVHIFVERKNKPKIINTILNKDMDMTTNYKNMLKKYLKTNSNK